jgi:hypothetical protein
MRIHLPEPCHENWSEMSLKEKGRHCQKCNKEVHDFTSYSDAKLLTFFKSHSQVCGRFRSSQIGRDLDHKGMGTSKWVIAACSLLLLSSTDLQAQTDVKLIQDSAAYAQIQKPVHFIRIIQVNFDRVLSHANSISKMRMQLNDFLIEVDVDSTNSVRITVPQTSEGTLANFELFNYAGDSFQLDGVYVGNGALEFKYNAENLNWTASQAAVISILPTTDLIYPEFITMGSPMPYDFRFWPPLQLPIQLANPATSELIYTTGDTVLIDTPDIKPAQQVAGKPAIKLPKNNQSIGWIAGLSALVLTALLLVWRRFSKKFGA